MASLRTWEAIPIIGWIYFCTHPKTPTWLPLILIFSGPLKCALYWTRLEDNESVTHPSEKMPKWVGKKCWFGQGMHALLCIYLYNPVCMYVCIYACMHATVHKHRYNFLMCTQWLMIPTEQTHCRRKNHVLSIASLVYCCLLDSSCKLSMRVKLFESLMYYFYPICTGCCLKCFSCLCPDIIFTITHTSIFIFLTTYLG